MKPRFKVIQESVIVEARITDILARFLDIETAYSETLGDKNSAMPFNMKVLLLTDCRIYSKKEREVLMLFASIRNKFAHSADIDTYQKCFERLKVRESLKGLLKIDIKQGLEEELACKEIFECLLVVVKSLLAAAESFLDYRNAVSDFVDVDYQETKDILKNISNDKTLQDAIYTKLSREDLASLKSFVANKTTSKTSFEKYLSGKNNDNYLFR
ncbi:MAG TPA: hypothetical protein VGB63_16135 [Pedobacter sp.]|jgi:hypothetical protein